jgi:hypothetical protein
MLSKRSSIRGAAVAAAAAVALSTLTVALGASPAAAQFRGSDIVGTPATEIDPGPLYQAPTDSLTKVANRFVQRDKSVTTVIEALPGPAPTAPVLITVNFAGMQTTTQQYGAFSGNKFQFNFPALDGLPRRWDVIVDLVEPRPTGNISYRRIIPVDIVPEFDIETSPLTFKLLSDCDWAWNSEPVIRWYDTRNQYFETELSMDGGETRQVSSFARLAQHVTAYDGLMEPKVWWYESDVQEAVLGLSPGTTKLFPGGTHTRSWDQSDPDCTAHLEYKVTFHLWRYPTV